MSTYLINEKHHKKSIVILIQKYNVLIKELEKYKKRIEELEDELDIKLAKEALQRKERIRDFNIKDYV